MKKPIKNVLAAFAAVASFASTQVFAVQNIVYVSDYASVQAAAAALTPGATLWVDGGVHTVGNIVITHADIHVTGDKSAMLQATTGGTMLKLTGSNSSVSGLRFDLNDAARYGIEMTGASARVYDNYLFNGYNSDSHAAIYYNKGVGPVWIENNRVYDLNADNVGTSEDGLGSTRAIRVDLAASSGATGVFIRDNDIELIRGREGDGIQVLSLTPLSEMKILIEGNHIKNANRRAIKVQAKNAVVRGNIHSNTLNALELTGAIAVIDAFEENTVVANNVMDASLFLSGISVTGSNSTVADNVITAPVAVASSGTRGIYVFTRPNKPVPHHVSITGNNIKNPANYTIDLAAGSGHIVADNHIDLAGIQGEFGIQLDGADRSSITGNSAASDTHRMTYLVYLTNSADNNIVTANSLQLPSNLSYGAVRLNSGAGSLVTDNLSNSNSFATVSGASAGSNKVFDNINIGTGGHGNNSGTTAPLGGI